MGGENHWLVTSGGAGHGSYQLGWAERMSQENYNPNGYSGTSVGNLFSAFMAQYDHFRDGTRMYADIWEKKVQKTQDIYRTWWPSIMGPLKYTPALWKGSLFNTDPLQKILQRELNLDALRRSSKELRCVAVDMLSGVKVAFRKEDIIHWGWQAVYGSAAFPLGFPPVRVGKLLLTDGGIREVTPLGAAIEAGATKIDVLMCSSWRWPIWKEPTTWWGKLTRLLAYGKRFLDLLMEEIIENDIRRCRGTNHAVRAGAQTDKRYIDLRVYRPVDPLHGSSLDFNRETWQVNRERGYADAERHLLAA